MAIGLTNKVWIRMTESVHGATFYDAGDIVPRTDGIVTSVNDFFKLLVEANDIFNQTSGIPDRDKLIFAENIPTELIQRLNNESSTTTITDATLRDIRLVTYSASEQSGTPGAYKPGDPTIKNIKYRIADIFPDPDYTGYS